MQLAINRVMGVLSPSVATLIEEARRGSIRAIGRILTLLEEPDQTSLSILQHIYRYSRGAQVIGVTGIPGAGKSTLVGKIIGEFRRRGYRVAVVAIDPSSPLTRGSLMGDRLRMQEHATDPGVFIRSLPTRGLKGGLSVAALAAIEAFDAFGYDKIIVETVGVGQSEVDVMHAAHTIVVVTMPGAGDDIQALKAGVMEIGDIYVVNKSDKPEARQTYEYLSFALEKEEVGREAPGWTPRLLKTSAVMGQGIKELVDTIEEHHRFIHKTGLAAKKVVERRALLAKLIVESIIARYVDEAFGGLVERIVKAIEGNEPLPNIVMEALREAAKRLYEDVRSGTDGGSKANIPGYS
jgi:LAO/AO transport system kinase